MNLIGYNVYRERDQIEPNFDFIYRDTCISTYLNVSYTCIQSPKSNKVRNIVN